MKLKLKEKPNKFLHPTLGWLNEVETIEYYTSMNKLYPYTVSKFSMLFDKELERAYINNLNCIN